MGSWGGLHLHWVIRVEPGWYLYRLPLQDLYCAHSCTCVVYGTSVLFSPVLNIDTKRGGGGGGGDLNHFGRGSIALIIQPCYLICFFSAYMFAIGQIQTIQKTSAYCTLWVGLLECIAIWNWAREWFVLFVDTLELASVIEQLFVLLGLTCTETTRGLLGTGNSFTFLSVHNIHQYRYLSV